MAMPALLLALALTTAPAPPSHADEIAWFRGDPQAAFDQAKKEGTLAPLPPELAPYQEQVIQFASQSLKFLAVPSL